MAPQLLQFYSYALEGRRNSSQASSYDGRLVYPAVALSRTVQFGPVERPMGLVLQMKISDPLREPGSAKRKKCVGSVQAECEIVLL